MEAARLDKVARQANLASAALPPNPGSSAAGSYVAAGSEGGERTSRLMGGRSSAGGWASLVKSSSVNPKGARGIASASVGGMLQSVASLPPGQGAPPSPGTSTGGGGGEGYAVQARTSRTGPVSGLGEVAEGDGEAGHHRRSKTAMSEPGGARGVLWLAAECYGGSPAGCRCSATWWRAWLPGIVPVSCHIELPSRLSASAPSAAAG